MIKDRLAVDRGIVDSLGDEHSERLGDRLETDPDQEELLPSLLVGPTF